MNIAFATYNKKTGDFENTSKEVFANRLKKAVSNCKWSLLDTMDDFFGFNLKAYTLKNNSFVNDLEFSVTSHVNELYINSIENVTSVINSLDMYFKVNKNVITICEHSCGSPFFYPTFFGFTFDDYYFIIAPEFLKELEHPNLKDPEIGRYKTYLLTNGVRIALKKPNTITDKEVTDKWFKENCLISEAMNKLSVLKVIQPNMLYGLSREKQLSYIAHYYHRLKHFGLDTAELLRARGYDI